MNLPLGRDVSIFLDANVLISAAWKQGTEIAQLWEFEGIHLLTSNFVMAEVQRNLPRIDQIERLRTLLLKVRIHYLDELPDHPEADRLPAKDRHVLAAAILTRANLLVSGDKRHFGSLCGMEIVGVRIVAPPELLAALRHRLQ
jgi:predicted nucleic acid-binding protein